MYCPNCKRHFESGKWCPDCEDPSGGPVRLVEDPQASGFNLNLGDANAISGGLHMTDSHNVHNEDKSVHNISNVTNVTQVAAQKTEMEILQEKKTLYLNECKRAYEDNVLEQSEVIALEECRIKLGLDKSTANTILESVRVMSERNARKTELNPIARTKLKILTDNLQKNEVKALMQQIDSLEPLVNRYEHDELTRKFYLVLAALKSDKCIDLYKNTKTDNYWNTFWSYLAYIKSGRISEAEDTLASLDRFTSYPEDNMTVLATAGAIMMGDDVTAKELLNAVIGEYTPALQRFVDSIYLLLEPETAKEMGADENTCAFYLVNFFGQKDAKAKAEEERKRKEAEEAERKRQQEEEKKRKAEEESKRLALEKARREAEEKNKREAEAKKKAAEEARLKAEAEQKRREKEEQRKKSSAYSVILLEDPENEVQLALYESDYFDYPDDFLRIQVINHYMESIPCEILSSLKQAEAESIKSDLEGVGAKVKICLTSEIKDAERVSLDMEKLKKLAKADEERTIEMRAAAERMNKRIKEAEKKKKEEEEERRKQEEARKKAAIKTYNGHECVDLGLPSGTLWATCNIGASKPEEYGNYFAWGETSGYNESKSVREHYKFRVKKKGLFSSKWLLTKYCDDKDAGYVDNKLFLDKEDDAAHILWGNGWLMPTKTQLEELIDKKNTSSEIIIQNGVKGLLITSKKNGVSIFLPANDSNYEGDKYGVYFTRQRDSKFDYHKQWIPENRDFVKFPYYCAYTIRFSNTCDESGFHSDETVLRLSVSLLSTDISRGIRPVRSKE